MLARFAEGCRQAFVLRDGLGQLALRLEHPLLQRADALGRVLEPAAEDHDLFLERLQLRLEIADLALVLGQPPVVLRSHSLTSRKAVGGLASDLTPVLRSFCATFRDDLDDSQISPALA